jgi:hypothetical protein
MRSTPAARSGHGSPRAMRAGRPTPVAVLAVACVAAGVVLNEIVIGRLLAGDGVLDPFFAAVVRTWNVVAVCAGLALWFRRNTLTLGGLAVRCALALAALGVGIGLAEAALRIVRPQYSYAAQGKFVTSNIRGWTNPVSHRSTKPHPDTGEPHPVIYNSLGLRQHREFARVKPAGTTRIGVFGDSFTANLRMPVQYSFTEPLDYLLNRAGGAVEVLNFGTDGYGTDQIYLQYLEEGVPLDLDVVLYVVCQNDPIDVYENNLVDVGEDGRLVIREWYTESRLLGFVRNMYLTYLTFDALARIDVHLDHQLNRLANRRVVPAEELIEMKEAFAAGRRHAALDDALDRFVAVVSAFRSEVERNGGRFRVVTLPDPTGRRMAELLREGYDVVDLAEHFDGSLPRYRFENDVHWNEAANARASESLFLALGEGLGLSTPPEGFAGRGLAEYFAAMGRQPVADDVLEVELDPAASLDLRAKYLALEAPDEADPGSR